MLNGKINNALIFKTKQSRIDLFTTLTFILVENIKFEDVHFDELLNWLHHMNQLNRTLNSICCERIVTIYFESAIKYGII